MDLNNFKRAGELFIEAAKFKNENAGAISNAAYGYYLLGEVDRANAAITHALSLDPKSINAYNTLIQINRNKKFEDVIKQIPSDLTLIPEISFNLAIVAREQNLFEDSIALFQQAIDKSAEKNAHFFGSLGSTVLESVTKIHLQL